MSFPDVWNPTYEGLPADNENINLGASRIRDLKVNIRERAGIDHSWGDTLDNGQHNQVSFNLSTNDPALSGTNGYLYTKTVNSNTELFWRDSSGNVLQLTVSGAVDFQSFPSGTVMSFLQAAPPTGWTASAVFNDQMIRLTNATGGGTGGSWTISGTTVNTNTGSLGVSSNFAGSNVSGTVAGHTLSVTEIPAHTHQFQPGTTQAEINAGSGGVVNTAQFGSGSFTTDNGTGGGGSHTHGWSGTLSLTAANTVSGAPGASFANDATWRPAYVNACVGTKN